MRRSLLLGVGSCAVFAAFVHASGGVTPQQLAPTAHPPLPATATDMWLVPAETPATTRASSLYQPLADAASDLAAGNYDTALTLASRPALATSALADYAAYYKGLAQLRLNRAADARTTFEALRERKPVGYLSVSACARRSRGCRPPLRITTRP